MDRLGIGILRELLIDESTLTLQPDVRRPYCDIAKKLLVTEDTVRNRVHQMQQSGLIRGWRLGLNPTLLDQKMEYVLVDVNPPSSKEEVVQTARALPGVLGVQNFVDNTIGITLAYAEREELDTIITRLKRKARSQDSLSIKLPFLPCKMSLSDTDWRLVKAIQSDPRKPYGEVARELGISRRTVKRRANRMMKGHAFWLLPELDLKKLDGVMAHLSVTYPPGMKPEIDREIFHKYETLMVMGHSALPEYSWFAFVVPNVGAADDIRAWTSKLKGVVSARVSIPGEIVYPPTEALGAELRRAPVILAGNGAGPARDRPD